MDCIYVYLPYPVFILRRRSVFLLCGVFKEEFEWEKSKMHYLKTDNWLFTIPQKQTSVKIRMSNGDEGRCFNAE